MATVPNTPYICIGCKSGTLQFLQVNGASGEPAGGVTEAHSLELLPYECELICQQWIALPEIYAMQQIGSQALSGRGEGTENWKMLWTA